MLAGLIYSIGLIPNPKNAKPVTYGYYEKHPQPLQPDDHGFNMVEGSLWYCEEHHRFEYWNGTQIVDLGGN